MRRLSETHDISINICTFVDTKAIFMTNVRNYGHRKKFRYV